MTDELITFLRARLGEDEQAARDATHGFTGKWTTELGYPVSVADPLPRGASAFDQAVAFDEGSPSTEQAAHIARHDPARVLTEVKAKRVIVDRYAEVQEMDREDAEPEFAYGRAVGLGEAVRLLALPYAEHAEYQESWRP